MLGKMLRQDKINTIDKHIGKRMQKRFTNSKRLKILDELMMLEKRVAVLVKTSTKHDALRTKDKVKDLDQLKGHADRVRVAQRSADTADKVQDVEVLKDHDKDLEDQGTI